MGSRAHGSGHLGDHPAGSQVLVCVESDGAIAMLDLVLLIGKYRVPYQVLAVLAEWDFRFHPCILAPRRRMSTVKC
jgi:hypothetical protein